jgi:hypothetical protein
MKKNSYGGKVSFESGGKPIRRKITKGEMMIMNILHLTLGI